MKMKIAYADSKAAARRLHEAGAAFGSHVEEGMADIRARGEIEKYDPDQPRDEGGRWSDTGGGGGGSSRLGPALHYEPVEVASAGELFLRTWDSAVTPGDIANAVPGFAAKQLEAEAKLAAPGNHPTQTQYMRDGHYTPERIVVHDHILNNIFTDAKVEKALPAAGEQPTLVVLGGRGGSGKSWFSQSDRSPINASKFLYLNSDDIKEALPEYKGWNAALVHEESTDILSRADNFARRSGLNVIFDATMRSPGTMARLINEYRAAGYKIEGYYMHTAPQVSAVRAASRFMKTGRYVPPKYVLESTTNEKTFDGLRGQLDRWEVYDNNTSHGPIRVVGGGVG